MTSMQLVSATPSRRSTVGFLSDSIATRGFKFSPAKLLTVATLALSAVFSSTAGAQTNLKVGVINFGKLLEQAPQSQTVTDKLKTEFAARQNDILKMRQDLQTQQERFQKDQAVMGEEERVNLERKIRDGQRDLERTQNEYVEDLNVRRNEEVNKLQRDIVQRVQAYASAQKFDLIIADAVYFSAQIDITADVLKVLQEDGKRPASGTK